MKIKDIERFFTVLDQKIDIPLEVVLTGGAAAVLQGVIRATHDIDFEVDFIHKPKDIPVAWKMVHEAMHFSGQATGITPQYASDIDRWNAIPLPFKSSLRIMTIGKIKVRILDPGLWAIGKLTRYIQSDIDDLRIVLKSAKTKPNPMARLWGQALRRSPPSNMQNLFARQVESFFRSYAKEIWGSKTDPSKLIEIFLK